jgi:hypothetical protein
MIVNVPNLKITDEMKMYYYSISTTYKNKETQKL